MTLEEATAQITELKSKLEKAESQLGGVQTLIQKWGNEMGEHRKAIEDAIKKNAEGKGAGGDEEAKKLLARLEKIEQSIDRTSKGDQTEVELEKVKATLSPDQKKKANDVWKALKPEQKEAVFRKPDELLKFFKAAAEVPNSVPESLFGSDDGAGKSSDNAYRALFGLSKQETFVPGGMRSGADGFAGASKAGDPSNPAVERRLANGVIPRPTPKE